MPPDCPSCGGPMKRATRTRNRLMTDGLERIPAFVCEACGVGKGRRLTGVSSDSNMSGDPDA